MRLTLTNIEPLESRIAPATVIPLKFYGQNATEPLEVAVSGAGDVNRDGFEDFLLKGAGPSVGYVVFGSQAGTLPQYLGKLDGTKGFRIELSRSYFSSGWTVNAAGDVNGDGFADVIIGDPNAPEGGTNSANPGSGVVYVLFGKATSFGPAVDLSTLDGTNGFKIVGENRGDGLGTAVSGAGDVNGDGISDFIIGAPDADPHGIASGAAYVGYGQRGGYSAIFNVSKLSDPSGANGFKIEGSYQGDRVGYVVSGAGDLNGDGLGDVLVSSQPPDNASCYVIFGPTLPLSAPLAVSSLDGTQGFRFSSQSSGYHPHFAVSAAGDVNGDGLADIIIGSALESLHDEANGASYIIFGHQGTFSARLFPNSLKGTNGFTIRGETSGDHFGGSVSRAGDVNGDGTDDLLIGAEGADWLNRIDAGASYVIFGQDSFGLLFDLTSLDGSNGFRTNGKAANEHFGLAVSGLSDRQGDSFADFLVHGSGVNYEIFGSSANWNEKTPGGERSVLVSVDGHTGTYTDPQGHSTTVTVTKGTLTGRNFSLNSSGILQNVLLSAASFAGSNVTVSGPQLTWVDLPSIDAHGVDLGTVTVLGRLGFILAGDSVVQTPGLKALTVGGLGKYTEHGSDQAAHSVVFGSVGALTVKGLASAVDFEVQGGLLAGIGKITIAGQLDAGAIVKGTAGYIHASGDIGPVKIGQSIIGGADFSGISAGGKLGKVTLGGSLISFDPAKPVTLSALGHTDATTKAAAVAIAGLSVKKNVVNARILAGYDLSLAAVNADASIGAIGVSGFWRASSVAAGVKDSTGDGFGRNDAKILPDSHPELLARIASINIRGGVKNDVANVFTGITAEAVGRLTIHGQGVRLPQGHQPLDLDPQNHLLQLVLI